VVQDDVLILESFNTDFTKKYKGQAPLVLLPSTKEEVSEILKYCSDKNIAVVP
jgi:FAD/FMN-containing dehydrogenase